MTWIQRYRLRQYFRNSIVVLPVLGIMLALVITPLIIWIEKTTGLESALSPDSVRTTIDTLAAAMLTFIVFLSSALLLAVQLASAQLTPRVIAFVFRDPVTKAALTIFAFTFTLSLSVLVRIDEKVPVVASRMAMWSCIASICVFFYLIDHVGKTLRPSGVLQFVGTAGHKVIETVYPRYLADSPEMPREFIQFLNEKPTLTVVSPKSGVLLAFDVRGLVSLAEQANSLIEMVPQVGDFIAQGDSLFRVFQGGSDISQDALCLCIAVGQERTLEQDPAFAFRIIVDIASKALSPSINDPTTAVLAIDQVHHILHLVGDRHLDDGVICDGSGCVRLVYRTPDWQDFVQLAVTEIRQFGGQSIQVVRRLRAMLESLIATLPKQRAALLHQELSLLHRTTERLFLLPEDRALANAGDSQGIGGSPERRSTTYHDTTPNLYAHRVKSRSDSIRTAPGSGGS